MPAMTSRTDRLLHHPPHQTRRPGADTIFSDDAMTLIHDADRGLPRSRQQHRHPGTRRRHRQPQTIVDEQSAR